MAKSEKKEADTWMSRYIRLRDCIEYGLKNKLHPDDIGEFGECHTCGKIVRRKRADAGHFISRGFEGSSGVRYDERNVHLQCKRCNAFEGGRPLEYREFMLKKYGQEVIDELCWLHKNGSYKRKLIGIALMYKNMYESLCVQYGIKP